MAYSFAYLAPAVEEIKNQWPTALPPVTRNAGAEWVFSILMLIPLNSVAGAPSVPRESLSSRDATPQQTQCAVRLTQITETGCIY